MKRREFLHVRGSGVLLHPTSLPGRFGCGDLGPAAHHFVAQLSEARQRYWQMLPVCPVGPANSPYSSPSSFAGSPLLVSPEILAQEGWLDARALARRAALPAERVHYDLATRERELLLREAFASFRARAGKRERKEFERFCAAKRAWLDDHALFLALKAAHSGVAWTAWPANLRRRESKALARAREEHAEEIAYHAFVQFQFDRQWRALSAATRAQGVVLVGDLPFYVEHDSADVWAGRENFLLDSSGRPRAVAGVAPDYFSADGQLWGNPLYDWDALARRKYRWWTLRVQRALELFELVRLDHFIAFHRAWSVSARAKTARRGSYRSGPGAKLLERLRGALGGLPIIAEDLGTLVPEVHELRDRFDLPGMRVLQFSFGGDPKDGSRPFAYPARSVVYTGTHDNDTARGWFFDSGGRASTASRARLARERENVRAYLGTSGEEIHWDFIRLALMSASDMAIVPLQDVLGLGSGARMNRPGTAQGNWEWRFAEGELENSALTRLRRLTETYGRASEPNS
jgi:4-alpha-glucanotransferase